jgi:hypothetical protein
LEMIIITGWGSNMISHMEKKINKELLRVPESALCFLGEARSVWSPHSFPQTGLMEGLFPLGTEPINLM